jgi:hypothetical protein
LGNESDSIGFVSGSNPSIGTTMGQSVQTIIRGEIEREWTGRACRGKRAERSRAVVTYPAGGSFPCEWQ